MYWNIIGLSIVHLVRNLIEYLEHESTVNRRIASPSNSPPPPPTPYDDGDFEKDYCLDLNHYFKIMEKRDFDNELFM